MSERRKTAPGAAETVDLRFDDNALAQALFGAHHAHLALIEARVVREIGRAHV